MIIPAALPSMPPATNTLAPKRFASQSVLMAPTIMAAIRGISRTARTLGVVALHDLQEGGKNEQHSGHREAHDREGDRCPRDSPAREQFEVDERKAGPQLPHHECRDEYRTAGNRHVHLDVSPATNRLFDDAADDARHAEHLEDGADPIESPRGRVLALWYEEPHADDRNDDPRCVDHEDGTPVVVREQPAGQERSQRQSDERTGPS